MTVRPLEDDEKDYTTSEAARFVRRSYNSIKYNVATGQLRVKTRTRDGTLIFGEKELRRFASVKGIFIEE